MYTCTVWHSTSSIGVPKCRLRPHQFQWFSVISPDRYPLGFLTIDPKLCPPVIKHGVLDNPRFYFDDFNLHVVWGCVGISQLAMFDYWRIMHVNFNIFNSLLNHQKARFAHKPCSQRQYFNRSFRRHWSTHHTKNAPRLWSWDHETESTEISCLRRKVPVFLWQQGIRILPPHSGLVGWNDVEKCESSIFMFPTYAETQLLYLHSNANNYEKNKEDVR